MELLLNQYVCWQVHRLVVVDQHSNIQGIVSLSDILQALVLSPAGTSPPSVPDTRPPPSASNALPGSAALFAPGCVAPPAGCRLAWTVWFMWAGCC